MKLSPITLEILWARLISIADEASATFVRASFSTLVREANDFGIVITDREGRSVAQSTLSIPSFIGTLPATVRHFIGKFSLEEMKPGDVFITNDPWKGTGHIHDVTVVAPLFRKSRLVAFAAITSHMPDIGGRLRSAGIRDMYEEGLQIPMMKFCDAGVLNPIIEGFIRSNVRVPQTTMGDILGEVAACNKIGERLRELLDEVQIDFDDISAEIRGRSELAMREAIRAVPNGIYRYEIVHDGFEEPIMLKTAVNVGDDRINVDYAGSSSQIARAINVVPIYCFAYTAYAAKAVLSPEIPNNDGSFLPITTSAPEGSILNPRFPAPTGARGLIGHMLPMAFMGALSSVLPERVWAPGSGNSALSISGHHKGTSYASTYFWNAGQGASSKRDGFSVIAFPNNLSNTPIEIMESETPMVVLYRRIRTGSGGGGKHRGGDGVIFGFRFVGESPANCSFILARTRVPAPGLLGGEAGSLTEVKINGHRPDLTEHVLLHPGDVVEIRTSGGGGFGPPVSK